MKKKMPRIMIAAPGSGTGKTMLTCALLKAWKERGLRLRAYKCGPDYIDPMFHKEALGIDSANLDVFLCGRKFLRRRLFEDAEYTDLAVLEGVMGYYDGIAGISTEASSYDIADATNTPAVLLVDGRGKSLSILPEIQGFLNFRADSHIHGVILGRISAGMYPRLKQMIEEKTGISVYGYFPERTDLKVESRYLGLTLPGELEALENTLDGLGRQAEETLDLDGLLELAGTAGELEWEDGAFTWEKGAPVQIGVARDAAFCFFYRDNLEILEALGAEITFFSPLEDEKIPEGVDGLIFYGGYPELYAEKLSANERMRKSVRRAIEEGMPCIAECGGFLYLQEYLEDQEGRRFSMAGALPEGSRYTGRLGRFGYVTLSGGTAFGRPAGEIPAHEFHYYDSADPGSSFLAKKPLSDRSWRCIISTDWMWAGYPHIHYGGSRTFAQNFLEACRDRRKDR